MPITKDACMRRLAGRGFTRQAISMAISYTGERGVCQPQSPKVEKGMWQEQVVRSTSEGGTESGIYN